MGEEIGISLIEDRIYLVTASFGSLDLCKTRAARIPTGITSGTHLSRVIALHAHQNHF